MRYSLAAGGSSITLFPALCFLYVNEKNVISQLPVPPTCPTFLVMIDFILEPEAKINPLLKIAFVGVF